MNDDMIESSGPSQEFKQVLALILLTGAIVILAAVFVIQRELGRQREAKNWALNEFMPGWSSPYKNRLDERFEDEDLDLVADTPADESKWLHPRKLVFSYIANTSTDRDVAAWQPLLDQLAEATGIEVEHRQLESIEEQLFDLHRNVLHITALNTGSVPRAVNMCGFVPLCTVGNEDGSFGVRTKFIVPSDRSFKKIRDLQQERIMFTSLNSNSGFKAPIVTLQDEFGMRLGLDYDYGFSTTHRDSIRLIAESEVAAAPVASDMLERAVAEGDVEADDFRVIYESEPYPPAAIGYCHSLEPQIVEQIRAVFLNYKLVGTDLGGALRAQRFIEVTYKDDWALIRRIDKLLGVRHDLQGFDADDQGPLESDQPLSPDNDADDLPQQPENQAATAGLDE